MQKSDLDKYKLPNEPGIYIFRNALKRRIYIGKATNLNMRVKSYFNNNLLHSRGPLLVKMVEEAHSIDWEQTDSVLEALILEANLIKKYQPVYNTKEKSDKSFNYLVITNEDYPRVLIKRERELVKDSEHNHLQAMSALLRSRQLSSDLRHLKEMSSKPKSCGWPSDDVSTVSNNQYSHVFGPFPQGNALREALKIVRRIFPYRDKCKMFQGTPGTLVRGRGCFNAQIGLCPGVCAGNITKSDYAKTVRNIVLLFKGKKKKLIQKLELRMRQLAKIHEFEQAAKLRDQIYALKHINDVAILENGESGNTQRRIEAYDIAHMNEQNRVGVMVVLEDGEHVKSAYKKFRIRTNSKGDVPALKEVLTRRFAHGNSPSWRLPSLLVVDGGKAQINATRNILQKYNLNIPVIGVVKDKTHKPKAILGDKVLAKVHKKEILLANNESHRFAIGYHKQYRRKDLPTK